MVDVGTIEFALDWVVLFLSLTVFLVFVWHAGKFVPGEGKRIFALLTLFLGINFLTFLFVDGLEIAHFLTLHKAPITEQIEEPVEVIAHILQIAGLAVLSYTAMIFAKFADKLEKTRKG